MASERGSDQGRVKWPGTRRKMQMRGSFHGNGQSDHDVSDWMVQVARPERDCPGGSERLAIVTLSPDTLR